ncbi:MAG: coagulation factor 5/8 type, partial [Frankiales bacterium]|nr:coagulation factor 5/8 type [Frankiales bacterium]
MRGVPSTVEVVDPPRPVVRLRLLAVSLLLVVTAFHQSAGLIGNDTKLDLTADPGRFLHRALDLWNPSSAGGQLQNQAYGYLFPMGLFHWVGYEIGLPGWVVQRLWMALLLVTAFLGVVRLGGRLALGTHTTQVLGGLAYALAPRVLTEVGGNSSEILPFAVLPWVLLPLIRGEDRPRRAAARSGVAVLCMGAVNATAVLALLPLPALWLVPGLRRGSGRRLALWWSVCVGLAITWWFVPLLLQGRYSPNFLNYIETAATTTSTTSPGEVLRGTSHWLGYVATGGGPWWRSGWTLVTNSVAILNTAVLAGLCLVGLVRRRMPAQGRLVTVAAIGLIAMCAAHAGPLDGPAVSGLQHLLDGTLAPFRNIHKFDALVRLPLALGLCHLLSRFPSVELRRVVTGATTVALIGSAIPALAGQLVPTGGYDELPSWWQQTGAWLDDHDATGRALVVPAASFGEFQWGRPLDNPLQALTTTDWVVRDAVPLGSPGLTRLLDAVENRLETGLGSQALAPVLARSGVHYLVVSNDLDPARTGAPRPVLVHEALTGSPGLTRVASFGPKTGGQAKQRAVVSDDGLDTAYPAVEVWEVS